jgi:hypothetical protein
MARLSLGKTDASRYIQKNECRDFESSLIAKAQTEFAID